MTFTGYLTRQCPRLVSLLAAGAIAVGTLIATATDANAEPISEGTIKSECKAAGGTYVTFPPTKKGSRLGRFSTCTYKDINGNTYTDDYVDGEWINNDPPD